MSVTGWKFPGTAANVNSGADPWTNVDYAKTYNSTGASCEIAEANKNIESDALLLTNFGFTSSDIPTGSTIDGYEWVISKRHSGGSENDPLGNDTTLKLYADGLVGNNMASAVMWDGQVYHDITYGGATEKCGTGLEQSDIISNAFGISLTISASLVFIFYVDYIKIRVYYTEGGGSPTYATQLFKHKFIPRIGGF